MKKLLLPILSNEIILVTIAFWTLIVSCIAVKICRKIGKPTDGALMTITFTSTILSAFGPIWYNYVNELLTSVYHEILLFSWKLGIYIQTLGFLKKIHDIIYGILFG